MKKSDLMGRFDFDGAEGIAFWIGDSDTEPITKVMFDELETLKAFIEHNLPGMFGAATRAPVQGEPNDDREALDNVLIDAREAGDGLSAVRNRIIAAGFSRATVPDAATGRFECDRNCVGEGSPVEDCSAHGRTPRDLWEQIDKVVAARDRWESLCGKGVEKRLALEAEREAATEIARSLARASTITGADAEAIAGASMKLAALGEIAGAPEHEWEYGHAHSKQPQNGQAEETRADAERRVNKWNDHDNQKSGLLVRRRKAGPWLTVEGELNENSTQDSATW